MKKIILRNTAERAQAGAGRLRGRATPPVRQASYLRRRADGRPAYGAGQVRNGYDVGADVSLTL